MAVSVLAVVLFACIAIFRLQHMENDLPTIINTPTDDWHLYAKNALDIKQNGIAMLSVKGEYVYPAGFIYNYFIAICFFCFGENTLPIYFIQCIMLGLAIAFIYSAFYTKLKKPMYFILAASLILFGLIDVNKYYSFSLLSENLVVFSICGFIYFTFIYFESLKLTHAIASAVFLGISTLTRPNLLPFSLCAITIIGFYFTLKHRKVWIGCTYVLFAFLTLSLLGIRNYIVTQHFYFLPVESVGFGKSALLKLPSLDYLFRNTMSCLGFVSFTKPYYAWRPHWTAMWIGYVIYLINRIRAKKPYEMWETLSHSFIFLYYITVILVVNPDGASYGFRFFFPGTFLVLPFSIFSLQQYILREKPLYNS